MIWWPGRERGMGFFGRMRFGWKRHEVIGATDSRWSSVLARARRPSSRPPGSLSTQSIPAISRPRSGAAPGAPPRSFRTVAGVTPHEFGRAVCPVGQSRPARTSSATDGRATSRPSTPRSSRSAKNVAFSWSVSSIQAHTAKPSALARATTSGVRTSTPS